jgi:membrane associated rhomboid family serine protease
MQLEPGPWIVIVSSVDPRACADLALVLEARGVASRQEHDGSQFVLSVRREDVAVAAGELEVYRRENARVPLPLAPPPAIGRGWFGVVAFTAVLTAVAAFANQLAFGIDWLAVGRMDGGRMIAGEWWRALTALTLHVDADHLLGNVAFGALFAYFIGRYLGGGVGWIAILAAGALGNLLNGWLQGADHRSIGASTAVFGALGLLTAHTWRRGFPPGTSFRGRVAPLIAGLGLLAYTGTAGENTDLGAHLFGFIAGFALGLLAARFKIAGTASVQLTAGFAAWALVAGAWAWGIVESG